MTIAGELRDKGVGLAGIQTVFEGSDVNTFDRLWENQRRYVLGIPFGHAVADPAIVSILARSMDPCAPCPNGGFADCVLRK